LGGEQIKDTRRRRRSKDLLEIRKYFPGDDIRRINWKVYAHLNELFIRLGEETPPPESHFFLLLDSCSSPDLPDVYSGDYLDSLIEAFASLTHRLVKDGQQVTVAMSGHGPPRTVGSEQSRELLSALAEVWWTGEKSAAIELPNQLSMQVLLFSTPGSEALPRLLRTFRARRWSVSLFLKRLVISSPEGSRRTFKDLLFLHPEDTLLQPRDTRQRRRAGDDPVVSAEKFNLFLQEEILRYRNAPWRLKHVDTV
jgi:uncharacterized protein (DUF58 family)